MLSLSSISKFYRRQEIFILYFFTPGHEAENFKEEYKALADKLYGIIKVAAIDCKHEEELCNEEFGVYDFPSIMIYNENYGSDGERYRGRMEQGAIANSASRKMQSFVSSVNSDNYGSFVERDMEKNKVLLFTDKKSTPAIYKALSKKYLGKAVFGEVRKSETELI